MLFEPRATDYDKVVAALKETDLLNKIKADLSDTGKKAGPKRQAALEAIGALVAGGAALQPCRDRRRAVAAPRPLLAAVMAIATAFSSTNLGLYWYPPSQPHLKSSENGC